MFEFGQKITNNAYSFTIEEAFANTPNRSMSFIAPEFPTCNKTIPKILSKKIREVQRLVNKTTCENGATAMLSSPKMSKPKHRRFGKHFRHPHFFQRPRHFHHLHFRHRREADMCLENVQNLDGSESCIVECTEKGSVVNGVLQTCSECLVYTTLASDM